ncbi:hypothetical protein QAD02_014995, partial [Eretmocerus hayati]
GALKLLNVSVPPYVKSGESPRLECSYDSGGDQLYSVSWYKDNEHIYSFSTRNSKRQIFDVEGVRINPRRSNHKDLFLQNVNLDSTGYYACEVNTDIPPFKSVKGESLMEVLELPRNKPKITGVDRIYATGDILSLNCTSDFSHPAAHLQWFINDVPIEPDSEETMKSRNLYSSRSSLKLQLSPAHMTQSSIRIKCTSTVQTSSLVKQPFRDIRMTEIHDNVFSVEMVALKSGKNNRRKEGKLELPVAQEAKIQVISVSDSGL